MWKTWRPALSSAARRLGHHAAHGPVRTIRRGALPWYRVLAVVAFVVAVVVPSACSTSGSPPAAPVSLPAPKAGQVTFYLSLPSSLGGLLQAANNAATPGSRDYRHFTSLATAAQNFGASGAQINAVAKSINSLGLQFAADPTQLFGRVTGTAAQWQKALGTPLVVQAATASSPFTTYSLPAQVPAALQPSGTSVIIPQAQVYDPGTEGHRPPSGNRPTGNTRSAASATTTPTPWPLNTGTPFDPGCAAQVLQQHEVYTEQQVQTAYGVNTLRAKASGTPVITVLDLGGGWLPSDLKLAGQCFGYSPPTVAQVQGDGVATAIANADDETSLDLQTAAAVAPNAQVRLVQTTPASMLDGFSRAVGDSRGLPDVISVSYGGCALAEDLAAPGYVAVLDAVLAMTSLTGVSTFVAAGDSGSTTCGTNLDRTTLSYPAVSPFVTAVGGTRLTLGAGNARVAETVWNDSAYGQSAAGGGGVSRREPRPTYQNGANTQATRAVPDVSALADIVPGWPVEINGTLQTVGGTSGSTPFTAAATALVAATQRNAGQPPIGLANGWFYQAAATQPSTFSDVTQGNNDLAAVGCCQASRGYDPASGLGVPNWATLPAALPKAG
jgi:subtilase family serine protease